MRLSKPSNPLRPALLALLFAGAPGLALPPEPILPERPVPDSLPLARLDGLTDLTGERHAVAAVFLAAECPLSRAALPALNALSAREGKGRRSGLRVIGIVPREATGSPALEAMRREQGIRFALVGDPDLVLAKALGAHVTPEAVFLDSAGRVVYRGAVDDRAADLRRKRPRATKAYLDTAVAQWRAGKPVEPAAMRATGCFIE